MNRYLKISGVAWNLKKCAAPIELKPHPHVEKHQNISGSSKEFSRIKGQQYKILYGLWRNNSKKVNLTENQRYSIQGVGS